MPPHTNVHGNLSHDCEVPLRRLGRSSAADALRKPVPDQGPRRADDNIGAPAFAGMMTDMIGTLVTLTTSLDFTLMKV